MKRIPLLLLALILALSALLPAQAAAVDAKSNASEGIRFSSKTLVVYVGERYDMASFLRYKKSGREVDPDGITWKSSRKASVIIGRKDGVAVAMKPGNVIITATTANRKKATIKLIVKRNKLDKIYGAKPGLDIADYNDYELVLKSKPCSSMTMSNTPTSPSSSPAVPASTTTGT